MITKLYKSEGMKLDRIETSIKYNLDKKHHFLPSDYRDPDNVARSKPSPINSNA